jgi:WD40 repeat protein
VKIWSISESSEWIDEGQIVDGNKAGEIWAIALSEDGQFLASTTYDGRINVWDLTDGRKKIREYETKGSFGMCIDMSRDGRFTASGHENGGVYIFNNDTGKMQYSLPGKLLRYQMNSLVNIYRPCQASTDSSLFTSWHSFGCCWGCESHSFVRCSARRTSCKSYGSLCLDILC